MLVHLNIINLLLSLVIYFLFGSTRERYLGTSRHIVHVVVSAILINLIFCGFVFLLGPVFGPINRDMPHGKTQYSLFLTGLFMLYLCDLTIEMNKDPETALP